MYSAITRRLQRRLFITYLLRYINWLRVLVLDCGAHITVTLYVCDS